MTNSERRISRQRAFRPLPGGARPDWWIVTQVARRMGFAAQFPYGSPADIFREHAALSAFENDGSRDFDLGALAGIGDAEYDALEPVQWPVRAGVVEGTARLFGDGHFYTQDRRARFVAVRRRMPVGVPDQDYPLVLNTGRLRDHWHTMTRTGTAPRLWQHTAEPVADIHPADVERFGLADGGLVLVRSRSGSVRVRVRKSANQERGTVFVPMHWSDRFTLEGVVGRAIAANVDPVSGQPELKHTPVRLEPVRLEWSGFLLSRRTFAPEGVDYWARSLATGCSVYELAGTRSPDCWDDWANALLADAEAAPIVQYQDPRRGVWRWACLTDDRLESCLFVTRTAGLPSRDWLVSLFAQDTLDHLARRKLLSGAGATGLDRGPIVCACFGLGMRQILDAIRDRRLADVEAVGDALRAGTNCGSCIPELRTLLQANPREDAA